MKEPYSDETFESVLTHMTRNLAITVAFFVGLLILHSCLGCSSHAETPRVGISDRSIVTLLRVEPAKPEITTTASGEPAWGRMRDRLVPTCTAFVVAGPELVTAAHCVPGGLGSVVRYLAPDGIGYDTARVARVDRERDQATLTPVDSEGLVPLETSSAPGLGEIVLSFSAVYEGTARGRVEAHYTGPWYGTTQTIVFGWSGSPVLDGQGRVWAVVAKCPLDGAQCEPGHAIVSAIGP